MALERSRLTQAKTLAQRQQDHRAVEQIDEELTRLNETAGSTTRVAREETTMDMLAKVNERNRKANVDAVRQSELLMVERKKRARMLAASGPPAPGSPVPQDPSVRLKTIPRTFNPASPSRFVCIIIVLYFLYAYVCSPFLVQGPRISLAHHRRVPLDRYPHCLHRQVLGNLATRGHSKRL